MPRSSMVFVVVHYHSRHVCKTSSKRAAAELVFPRLPEKDQASSSVRATVRRVSPVYYCPSHRLLWFQLISSPDQRPLHPSDVPTELLADIPHREADNLLNNQGLVHIQLDLRGEKLDTFRLDLPAPE